MLIGSAQSILKPDEAVAASAPGMLRHTRPIYRLERGRPERELTALGSGFFIRYLNRTVFVTAAHVAREAKLAELFIPTMGTTIETIPGGFYHTRSPTENPDDDRLDVAFTEVPPAIADRLPPDHVFTCSDWDVRNRAGPHSHYVVCGWPAKRNQPSPHNPHKLPRAPISYHDICHPTAAYGPLGVEPRTHYVMQFDQKRALDEKRQLIRPPQLYGVSGSPVFFFHRYSNPLDYLQIPMPKLVGIAIEVHAREKAIVVTRLSVLLAALRRQFEGPEDPSSPDTVTIQPP